MHLEEAADGRAMGENPVFVLVFYTHGGAIRTKRTLTAAGVGIELAPTPRELSSSCGVAGFVSGEASWERLVDDDHVERIYLHDRASGGASGQFELVYEAEEA